MELGGAQRTEESFVWAKWSSVEQIRAKWRFKQLSWTQWRSFELSGIRRFSVKRGGARWTINISDIFFLSYCHQRIMTYCDAFCCRFSSLFDFPDLPETDIISNLTLLVETFWLPICTDRLALLIEGEKYRFVG